MPVSQCDECFPDRQQRFVRECSCDGDLGDEGKISFFPTLISFNSNPLSSILFSQLSFPALILFISAFSEHPTATTHYPVSYIGQCAGPAEKFEPCVFTAEKVWNVTPWSVIQECGALTCAEPETRRIR